jgi:hypothetical protein
MRSRDHDDEADTSHERYLRLYRLVRDRDDAIAGAFDDLHRSTFVQRLAAIHLREPLTAEELGRLSPRASVEGLADLWRQEAARRRRPRWRAHGWAELPEGGSAGERDPIRTA